MDLDTLLAPIRLIIDEFRLIWPNIVAYYQGLSAQELSMQLIGLFILFIFILSIILAIAVVFLRLKNHLKFKRLHKLEKSWEAALIREIMDDESGPGLPRIKPGDEFFFVRYLYRFAQRLSGNEREHLKGLAQPYLGRVLKGLKENHPELRARNINLLGAFGFPQYIPEIKLALNDPAPIVCMTAARTLAKPGYPEHCDLILDVLVKFDEWSMSFLSSMLARMGPEAAPVLRRALASPKETVRVRIACAEALRDMGDIAAGDVAAQVLKQDANPELRAALLKLIGALGVARHRPTIRGLINAKEFIIRLHAISALGRVGDPEDGDLIFEVFNDESEWVSLHAARALLRLGREDLLRTLSSQHPRTEIARQVLAEGLI